MPNQNLPKELLEEIKEALSNDTTMAFYREDVWCLFIKVYSQGKAAGYKDGILGAMEEIESGIRVQSGDWLKVEYRMGWNECRSTLLSRLEERLNDGVQE